MTEISLPQLQGQGECQALAKRFCPILHILTERALCTVLGGSREEHSRLFTGGLRAGGESQKQAGTESQEERLSARQQADQYSETEHRL